MNISCTTETSTITGSGKYGIDYASYIVPLCNGWILYGDLTNNKVQAVNVLYGVVGNSYQLGAVPGDLAYDATTGFLYATLSGASSLAEINLNNGVVTNIPLAAPAIHLAAASNGYVFASLSTNYNSPNEAICYINGNTGTVLGTASVASFNANAYIACNSAGTTLYVGADGCSNCTTYQFLFNTSTYTLTTQYTASGTYTTNGEEMDISPDGNHLAWVNGGGNGVAAPNNYSILDLYTTNINNSYGDWVTKPYPTSAGFDPFSSNITTTNDADLQVWSVSTHAVSKATWVGASAGSGGTPYNIYELKRVRFSRGGGYVFGLDEPTYTTPAPSTIVWESFP
jgi:hypothetical protein